MATPNRDSRLTLREIDENNWRAVTKLDVHDKQRGNLASTAMSMLESHYDEDAWVRAIYAETADDHDGNDDGHADTMVGFLMMAIWEAGEAYYIWRLMIDQRYQGLGYGKRVVAMAIEHTRQNYQRAEKLGVNSTPREGKKGVRPEDSPFVFYERLGFKQAAPPDEDGEILMHLDLQT
jgi:diamine N-acetyltransferase